nr:hypothetical protein [Escherichia coli]
MTLTPHCTIIKKWQVMCLPLNHRRYRLKEEVSWKLSKSPPATFLKTPA